MKYNALKHKNPGKKRWRKLVSGMTAAAVLCTTGTMFLPSALEAQADGETSPSKVTNAAHTSDFIELNLYDYGSNINDKWNSNKKYPGFQWNGGAYMGSSYDRHTVDYIDFGNSIITDFTYGFSQSGSNGYSSNRSKVGNQGGDINKLDVSDFGVTNRPVGMSLNSSINDKSSDVLSRTLGTDGYPALADGTSLAYLFNDDDENGFIYADKQNNSSIDGLFQQDATSGKYYYNSRENHAQYSNNTFTLYNQIITPNFIVYPFGNFLPLNTITDSGKATQVNSINMSDYITKINERLLDTNATHTQLKYMLNQYATNVGSNWDSWTAPNAIEDYFKGDDINDDKPSDDTSLITDILLSKMYNIDWDVPTNFFFGMDMSMDFMQPKDGMTGKDNKNNTTGEETPDGTPDYPMEFNFSGDDDVWVYIDDVLFLDLTGIHRHVGGKIDFVNGLVHYYALDTAGSGDVSTTPYKTYTFAEILTAAGKNLDDYLEPVLDENGNQKSMEIEEKTVALKTFKDYSTHSFNFYYMERGSGSSVCRMEFNFPLLKKNTIAVGKELTGNTALGNPDFSFQVLDSEVKTNEDGATEDILFIPAYTTYELYEMVDPNDPMGYPIYEDDGKTIKTGKTDANGIFTLKAGQMAAFPGIDENAGQYYVRELFTSEDNTYDVTVNGGSAITKSDDITIGATSFIGINSSVMDMSNGSTFFTFSNTISNDPDDPKTLKGLSITKELNDDVAGKEFSFAVTLNGNELPQGYNYTITEHGKDDVIKSTAAGGIITIPAGATATIDDIYAGTTFTVTETTASQQGYNVIYSVDGTKSRGSASGTIKSDANVTVTATNAIPTITKQVQEDSNSQWGNENSAEIGQTVNFQTTVSAKAGAENYVVHDKMDDGLTFGAITSVKAIRNVGENIATETLQEGTHYNVVTNLGETCPHQITVETTNSSTETPADGNVTVAADETDSAEPVTEYCDFRIEFTDSYMKTINDNVDIVIEYTATLNEDAVISTNTNDNDTMLAYSTGSTDWVTTQTLTYSADIVKTNNGNKVLSGAEFKLYDALTGGNEIPVILVDEANNIYRIYRTTNADGSLPNTSEDTPTEDTTDSAASTVAEADNNEAPNGEAAGETPTPTTIKVGKASIVGLDANTDYYLEETKAPSGYHKQSARIAITATNSATVTDGTYIEGGIQITNSKNSDNGSSTVSYEVQKVWNDEGHETDRPTEVTVNLFKNNDVYDTQTLSENNNWTYTWEKLPNNATWRVKEVTVAGYDTKITREGNTFVVTNTYDEDGGTTPTPTPTPTPDPDSTPNPTPTPDPVDSSNPTDPESPAPTEPEEPTLPETGQLWWPVSMLLAAGLALMLTGLLRRRGTR